jgi:hypothetical protein
MSVTLGAQEMNMKWGLVSRWGLPLCFMTVTIPPQRTDEWRRVFF